MSLKDLNIKAMLPHLGDEALGELAMKLLHSRKGEIAGVHMSDLLPYLDDDMLDQLAMKEAKTGRDISAWFPYMSGDGLQALVDAYLAGEIPTLRINQIYPYLDEEDLNRLFIAVLQEYEEDDEEPSEPDPKDTIPDEDETRHRFSMFFSSSDD